MNQGKFVFAQLFEYINKYEFDKCVDRYQGDYKTKEFSCWSQFLYMAFGQFTHRESCTDIITCLNEQRNSVYHLGLKQSFVIYDEDDAKALIKKIIKDLNLDGKKTSEGFALRKFFILLPLSTVAPASQNALCSASHRPVDGADPPPGPA